MTLCLSNYGDKCCKLHVLMFGLWLFSRFTPPLKVKVSSYITQYPIFRIAQSAIYTLLSGRPVQSNTISVSLRSIQPRGNFAKTAKYSSLSIARYSFKQLSELEHCRVKQLAQGFTRQHRIRTRVLLVESSMLYP